MFLVCLVIFCSTGLFFCFFLPSGAVLFSTGALLASGSLPYGFITGNLILFISCLAGSWLGYFFGRQIGPSLYNRKDSFFFKRKHLEAAETFYQKHGKPAMIAGYFLPIIRSFSLVVAGITRVDIRTVFFGTVIGSLSWILTFTGSGYFIGSRPFLKPWLGYIVGIFICVITIPLLIKIIRSLRA